MCIFNPNSPNSQWTGGYTHCNIEISIEATGNRGRKGRNQRKQESYQPPVVGLDSKSSSETSWKPRCQSNNSSLSLLEPTEIIPQKSQSPRGAGLPASHWVGGFSQAWWNSWSNFRPTVGSISVPSRAIFTSRLAFHGLRSPRVRWKGTRAVESHWMRKGLPNVWPSGSGSSSKVSFLSLRESSCSSSDDSTSQKMVPRAVSSIILPLGAVLVAVVVITSSSSRLLGRGSGLAGISNASSSSSLIGDNIRAYPKYSPDLLAENIR